MPEIDPRGRRRPSLYRFLWLGLAGTALALAAFVGVPWAQVPPAGGGVSVTVKQLDWIDANGQVAAASSTSGIVDFSFTSAAAGLAVGPDGAYLNLYTSIDGGSTYQLAVENLWVQSNTTADLLAAHPSAWIDLGNADGTAVANLRYQVSLTHDPVTPLVGAAAARGSAKAAFATDFTTRQPFYTDFPGPIGTDFPGPITTDYPAPVGTDYDGVDPEDTFFDSESDSYDDLSTDYEEPAPAPVYVSVPLPAAPVYVAPPVQHVGLSIGGYGGGGLVGFGNPPRPLPFRPVWRPAQPQPQAPPPAPPRPGLRPRPLGAVLRPVPVVNESPMSCAPSAVARSIRYMLDVRGRGGANAQQIMNGLYGAMGTSAVNGTSLQGILNGKANYSAANGLGIQTAFGVNAATAGATLNNGGDVELNILWPNTRNGNRGCPGGGHVAMVTSITQLANGNFQITYVDDENQHDGVGTNNNHTLIVRPNGAVISGFPCPGGVVAGLLAENMR